MNNTGVKKSNNQKQNNNFGLGNGNKTNNLKNNLNNNNLTNNNLNNNNLNNNNLNNNTGNNNLNNNGNKNKIGNNLNAQLKNIESNLNNKKNESMFNSAANTVSEYTEEVSENETLMLVLKVVLVLILLIVLIQIVKYFYVKWDVEQTNSPMLVNGTKNGKNAFVISQDPNHTNYVPIKRSVDQDGIEFSYALWFLVTDFSYKQGEWKHIFHKGNSSSYPNRAPGVWIHPNTNMVRVYMNTMQTLLEYVDIDNIPLRKWVHMVIVVKNRSLSVYINGLLKIRKELSSLPRQNYGNVWTNMYGGYEGYLAKLQYFNRALDPIAIDTLVTQGPGSGNCIDTKEVPPYLDDSWWLK
jgi:hypothetical protein